MNGAKSLVATLVSSGVDVCFANPGTSEMHFLAALENPAMRSVLCLFEGVCTGAADGYYRMKREPASTLLHLGPGLANGLANLHNAKRASSGIVNIVGDHSTGHLRYDAPLKSDIEGLARPMSQWIRRSDTPQAIAIDAAAAVAQARSNPGRIATLILPGDMSWGDAGKPALPGKVLAPSQPPEQARIDHIARVLKSGEPTLIVLADRATHGPALELAGRVAAATGARLATQFFTARIQRGAGRVPLERIPYAVPQALTFLSGFKNIITVQTDEPIAFFSYPGSPSLLKAADCVLNSLVEPGEDSLLGMQMLVDALGATTTQPAYQPRADQGAPSGRLEPVSIAHALAYALPENVILVDESLTTGREAMVLSAGAAPHDMLQNMGGSIGFGTPVAVGAAVACPDRRVICMVGDGSAMYTIQSLWTHARERLDITTIIFANNAYQILKTEYANMGIGPPGPQALAMIDLGNPIIDWQAMAKSMGVPSMRVQSVEAFIQAMVDSTREQGPVLIEVCL